MDTTDRRLLALLRKDGRASLSALAAELNVSRTTNGAWDLVAELHAENLVEFERVLRGIRAMDGVSKSESSLLLTTL